MLRIAITDDHTLFRKSLKLLIDRFKDMKVVVEASNGLELLEKLKGIQVDIVLLDLQMPEMDGFETCQKVKAKYPEIKILVLTLMDEINAIKRVVKMGAQGYFTKNTPPKELEDAIWKLQDNGFYFEESLAFVINKILDNLETNIGHKEIQFTEREIEIIILTAQGLKSKEIADMLFISVKTVNAHKQNIQQKYGFDNMMTAILYCINKKIIDIGEIKTRYK